MSAQKKASVWSSTLFAEANVRQRVHRARTRRVRAHQRCIHGEKRRAGSKVPRHPAEQFVIAVRQSRR